MDQDQSRHPLTRLERLEGVDEIAELLEFGSFHDRFVVGLIEYNTRSDWDDKRL
jgi:hypothetical protein